MSNKPRTRLDVAARREQLLVIGSELFATRPYDEVWIDHVAREAGISRGLLYHYFQNKRGFLHAVVERETQAILAATAVDPDLPERRQLRASIDAYLAYVETHPHGYRALFRGAVSVDARVRELVDENLLRQADRILARAGSDPPSPARRIAVHGWIAALIAMALDWLDQPTLRRTELADLAAATLEATLRAAGTAGPVDGGGASAHAADGPTP